MNFDPHRTEMLGYLHGEFYCPLGLVDVHVSSFKPPKNAGGLTRKHPIRNYTPWRRGHSQVACCVKKTQRLNMKEFMQKQTNPKWWNKTHESSWNRVKEAFKRDWDQTKHDFGGNEPDTDQDVDDTVKQASGKQPIPPRGQPTYEEAEDAYRFGYAARSHYRDQHEDWDDDLERQLETDWRETYRDRDWSRYRNSIRRGWDYETTKTTV